MVLPYSRALVWLFLEGSSDLAIRQQLDEITMPMPEQDVLTEHKAQADALPLSPATRRRLARKEHNPADQAMFERLGFESIYLKTVRGPSPEWEGVQRLLRNPVMRIAVDVGVLCKYGLDDLSLVLPVAFKEPATQDVLALYLHYFFDHKPLAKADWRAFLKLYMDIPYAYVRYHTALTRPIKDALYLVGIPSKSAFTDFLRNVLTTAEYKFSYYARDNTPSSDGQARAWAKVGFDAGVRFEKFSATDVTDFSKSIQTAFLTEDIEIENISSEMLREVKPPTVDIAEATTPPRIPALAPDPENF